MKSMRIGLGVGELAGSPATVDDLVAFSRDGYLVRRALFRQEEVATLRAELESNRKLIESGAIKQEQRR